MKQNKWQKSKRWGKIITITVATLIVVRLILPFVVLFFANQALANMKGYYGHINNVDLAIIRGAYRLDSMYMNKVDTVTLKQTPFFSSAHVEMSVEWKALIHGSLAGEVILESPMLLFTKDKVEPEVLIRDSTYLKELFNKSMPLKINRFEIINGTIRYRDESSKPIVDIEMNKAFIVAQNLHNGYDSTSQLPALIKGGASVYDGVLGFTLRLNPMANNPTFDINLNIQNTNLVKLNDFFQAYAKVDVNKGIFGLYTEAAAKDGKFIGYIKPLINDLDVLGKEDREDNLLRKMWEGMVGTAGQVLKNQEEDQVATKINFEGSIEDPDASLWDTIANVLRNAFVRALQPAIDNQINLTSVNEVKEKKPFLQKVFGKKDDKKK
ncbi:MAG TPA: DUF748 domain-containing protein [Cyclobacteriaceae bacterium]|nr:DUF748 domain-containing protein [Cyclobacteriaceae bacterium]